MTLSRTNVPSVDGDVADVPPRKQLACFQEHHYTVSEVADLWNLSPDVVRRVFEREPGVMLIGEEAPRGKRRYTTLRIPQSVAERVHRRLCNPDLTGGRMRG